jgi:uncharacterized protein (TIGR02444 family)
MDEPEKPAEDGELWRFSLAFYKRRGVAEALIALQDRDRLDVNLMLFALWLGVSGRGPLGSDALAAAERASGTLRSEIIEPLRRLRRELRHHPDGDVQQLREGVKALELAGEKLAQARLARLRGRARTGMPLKDRLAAAHDNLALYLGPERVENDREAAVLLEALDAFARCRDRIG